MAGASDLELMMTELKTVYFRSRDGVHEVKLPAVDAVLTCRKRPHEWSLSGVFAEPPEGFVPSEGSGGGIARVRGGSVRVD
jgi:hypothetical protein